MEKIRELSILLQTGIEDYEEQQKLLQQERLKYMRLVLTNGFGDTDDTSQESWLLHLKDIEQTLNIRRNALRQSIKEVASQIIQEEQSQQEKVESKPAVEKKEELKPEERKK